MSKLLLGQPMYVLYTEMATFVTNLMAGTPNWVTFGTQITLFVLSVVNFTVPQVSVTKAVSQ